MKELDEGENTEWWVVLNSARSHDLDSWAQGTQAGNWRALLPETEALREQNSRE